MDALENERVLTIGEHTLVRHALHVVERAAKKVASKFRGFVQPRELLAEGTIELHGAARAFAAKHSGDLAPLLALGKKELYEAAREFQEAYSHDFACYAFYRVRCAMVRSIAADLYQERIGRAVDIATDQFWAYLTDREFDVIKHDEDEARRRFTAIANGMLGAAFMSAIEEAQKITPGEEVAEKEELAVAVAVLRAALPTIPERDRTILAALYRDLMTTKEASEALGIPHSAFKKRHALALKRLREALVAEGVTQAPRPRVALDPGCVLGLP